MSATAPKLNTKCPMLLSDMPEPRFARSATLPMQIAAYFRRLLLSGASRKCDFLELPTPCQLAGFFGCSEMVLMKALQEFERQGYAYELNALDRPVLISDPMNRERRNSKERWHSLSTEMLKPWDPVRQRTRNPLDIKAWMGRL